MGFVCDLSNKHCKPCEGGIPALTQTEIDALMIPGWQQAGQAIAKTCTFKDYYQVIAFVNAVAFIAHARDHHPALSVHFKRCVVRFNTHEVSGISVSDFDCAARVDALLA